MKTKHLPTKPQKRLLQEMVKTKSTSQDEQADDVPNHEPYFIEVDTLGCLKCGSGKTWTIIGPDEVATGQSWSNFEDADYICDLLNNAYQFGLTSNIQ